jgi:CubicO group peptidase (beta-lactamase class C family)
VKLLAIAVSIAFCARANSPFDASLQPYVRTGNLAGDVLVEKSGKIVFEKAYGFADREHRVRNTPLTQFHVASVSMQFTAAAVLRLVDMGSLRLDQRVADFVPEVDGANKISIRDLLHCRASSALLPGNEIPA